MWARLAKLSLSTYIFLGLILGAVCGLFFGEMCRSLDFIGKAFIMLLQMAVLPFIVVSLIHGIGSLSIIDARWIATKGSGVLLLFWTVGLVVIFSFALAFPLVQTSSFFSVSDITPAKKIDLLSTYIPANIFKALSEGTVPAIVLFSVFLGFALIGVQDKQPFLKVLSVLSQGLSRVTQMVVKTAPLGVFALTATAAGTLSLEQVQRLEVYFVCFILICLVLTFWVLPAIVSSLTTFRFKDILNYSKDALILGFVSGNNFIILPVIAAKSKELYQKTGLHDEKTGTMVDSVLPLAYCFPSVGRLMELLFIIFVAWYINQSIGFFQYLELGVAGVFSLFGSPKVGVPFLLNYMKLPSVYFDLYLISDVVTRKFKVILQSMSFQAFTLILSYIIMHKLTINLKKVLMTLGSTVILVFVLIIATRVTMSFSVKDIYHEDIILMGMEIKDTVPNKVFKDPLDLDYFRKTSGDKTEDILYRIKKRGVLRVGFNAEALPFAFFNQRNELVGYDVFFAHQLAKDLRVTVDFIPVDNNSMRAYLSEGICDIIMSAVPITAENLGVMNFTNPYMDMNAALIVKDYRKKDFRTRDRIKEMRNLRIACTPANTREERQEIKQMFRRATPVELPTIKDIFIKEDPADVLLTTDKIGKAWALLYPEFGVAVPHPVLFRYDIAYAVPLTQGDSFFLEYLNHWLKLKSTSGLARRQFDYWVLGKTPQRKIPRWSIIRNVLHWVH